MNCYLPENHIIYSIHQVVKDLDDSQYCLIKNGFGYEISIQNVTISYSEDIFSARKI